MNEPTSVHCALEEVDLLRILSHDLRQPIQSIGLLNAAILQVTDPASIKEIARLQRESLDQLNGLLKSLLDLIELEPGTTAPDLSSFHIARVLDYLREEFGETAADRGLDFHVQHNDAVVTSDLTLMTGLLRCLLSHALRNTNRGLVHLCCASEPGELVLAVHYTPARGQSGLDEETGLQLIVARRIARLLAIPLDREPPGGEGTRLTVRVSVDESPASR